MGELCFCLVFLYVFLRDCTLWKLQPSRRAKWREMRRTHEILFICVGFLSFLHWWIVASCCLWGCERESEKKRWNGCARFPPPLLCSNREFQSWLEGICTWEMRCGNYKSPRPFSATSPLGENLLTNGHLASRTFLFFFSSKFRFVG